MQDKNLPEPDGQGIHAAGVRVLGYIPSFFRKGDSNTRDHMRNTNKMGIWAFLSSLCRFEVHKIIYSLFE
jgi:hypothetical protein